MYLPVGKERMPMASSGRSLPRLGQRSNFSKVSLKLRISRAAASWLSEATCCHISSKSSRAGSESRSLIGGYRFFCLCCYFSCRRSCFAPAVLRLLLLRRQPTLAPKHTLGIGLLGSRSVPPVPLHAAFLTGRAPPAPGRGAAGPGG